MNDRELKYHKALQPVYEKAMGPWREFDNYVNRDGKRCVATVFDFEPGGEPRPYLKGMARIPAAIDSDGPDGKPSGRCLWGMVESISSGHCITLKRNGMMCSQVEHTNSRGVPWITIADTPVLALLKCLCAQHGVEAQG